MIGHVLVANSDEIVSSLKRRIKFGSTLGSTLVSVSLTFGGKLGVHHLEVRTCIWFSSFSEDGRLGEGKKAALSYRINRHVNSSPDDE